VGSLEDDGLILVDWRVDSTACSTRSLSGSASFLVTSAESSYDEYVHTWSILGNIMAAVKTAISIDRQLLKRVDGVSRELDLSRSRVIALAAADFVEKFENARLLRAMNDACGAAEPEAEATHRRRMKKKHRTLVEGEW